MDYAIIVTDLIIFIYILTYKITSERGAKRVRRG